MPTIEELRLRSGQVITEDWYDKLCSVLSEMYYDGAVDMYGYAHKDIVPDWDLVRMLGSGKLRWKEVHCGYSYASYSIFGKDIYCEHGYASRSIFGRDIYCEYGYASRSIFGRDIYCEYGYASRSIFGREVYCEYGYASSNMFVQGKQVLKDGDPIYIADLFAEAISSVTQAVRDAHKPTLLAKVMNYSAPPMADIFGEDVCILLDGRLRTQMVVDMEVYAYLKRRPAGETSLITALLNDGKIIPASSWQEFDTTVMKDDHVNLQVYPSANVSVLLFNLPTV